jgi:hypothetical protein
MGVNGIKEESIQEKRRPIANPRWYLMDRSRGCCYFGLNKQYQEVAVYYDGCYGFDAVKQNHSSID